jgi:hypothetical protein
MINEKETAARRAKTSVSAKPPTAQKKARKKCRLKTTGTRIDLQIHPEGKPL